jgi:hypothetical protein
MTDLKKIKLKNDYKKVEERISSCNDYKKLCVLANNIRKRIDADADYKHFVRLADNAEFKAKIVRLLAKCPSPINDSVLEQMAFNNFVEGCAVLDKTPSVRVIHNQLKKLGYAKTMADKGVVRHTSEYFVFKYAKHLTNPKTYKKVAEFFNSNEGLLEVA